MAKGQSRTVNSIKNIVTGFGGQLLSIVLKFIVRTVFIHTLGKAYLGINGLFSDILNMLSLTELGLDTAINFKLYKPLAEKDTQRVRVLMKFYRQAYRVVGIVILIMGLCLIPVLPYLIRDYGSLENLGINATVILILYILRTVSSYLFFAYRNAVVIADQKKYILDIADIWVTIIENLVQIAVLYIIKNFVVYTAILIFSSILRNLVKAVIGKKMYPDVFIREDGNLSKEEVLDLFKDCGSIFLYKMNGVVIKATDNMVISAFIGLAAVGLYSNYLLFYTTIIGLLGKIYVAIKASAGNLFAVESVEKQYKFFRNMNFFSAVMYGTAGVGVAVCGDELIRVWIGADYLIPDYFAILIGTEILIYGLTNNLGQIRNVSGVFQRMWYRPLLSVLVNLATSVILVQIIGIHGVIIGTVLSFLLTDMLFDPFIIHKFSFDNIMPVSSYYAKNALYLAVLTGMFFFNVWICQIVLPGIGWISVIIHALFIAVDVPLAFLLFFRKTQECRYFVGAARRLSGKIAGRL